MFLTLTLTLPVTGGSDTYSAETIYNMGSFVSLSPPSTTPLSQIPAAVVTEITVNGEQYSTDGKSFQYYPGEVLFTNMFPVSGPVTGGTSVTMVGTNFTNTGEISCRFGYTRTGYFYTPAIGAGSYLNSTHVVCVSPDTKNEYDWSLQKMGQKMWRYVKVELALNGQQYHANSFDYTYYPSINSVQGLTAYPAYSPGASGGTYVLVSGTNFYQSGTAVARLVAAGKIKTWLADCTSNPES